MVNAAPQAQWRLLDLQDVDTRLAQLAHRRRTLPEHAELEALGRSEQQWADRLVAAQTVLGDITRELTRAESDVEQVRRRADRDQARLDSGQGSAKDLQALQHELVGLAARQAALEEVQLEVMERLEAAQERVTEVEQGKAEVVAQVAAAAARRDEALATLDAETAAAERDRAERAGGVPTELLALYEKIRTGGGVGAARLRGRRCEGCRMELDAADLGRIKAAADDVVLRCEQCSTILVRTPESGL